LFHDRHLTLPICGNLVSHRKSRAGVPETLSDHQFFFLQLSVNLSVVPFFILVHQNLSDIGAGIYLFMGRVFLS
jgi:hypothetical protein